MPGNDSVLCLPPAVFDKYQEIAEKPIEDSIKSELSGDFERLMLAVGTRWTLSFRLVKNQTEPN